MRLIHGGVQVTWKECLSDNAAWDTLTWFAALIGMASYLNKYGFIKWFSNQVRRSPSISSKLHNGCLRLSLSAWSPASFRAIPCTFLRQWVHLWASTRDHQSRFGW